MELVIKDVLPEYFQENRKNSSEIWGKDLEFGPGEKIKIVAPSGKGKSSLMHFLYGLRRDYNGKILYGKKNISGFNAEDFAHYRKNHISIVFQDLRLFPEQTVLENFQIKHQLKPYHPDEMIREFAKKTGCGAYPESKDQDLLLWRAAKSFHHTCPATALRYFAFG